MNSSTVNFIFACVFVIVIAFSANVEARRGGGGSIIIMGGQGQHGYVPYPVMMSGWGCGHSGLNSHSGWGWGH